jgi:DNA modification methylase
MKVRVSKLRPHPLNQEIYDLSDIEDLMSSISDMGLLQNLVIDQDHQVISGNRRLESIIRLGWKQVDCDQITVEPDDVESYLIHYNKQRVKTCRELLNEVGILLPQYAVGKGKRTDLTSVPENTGGRARDKIADIIGVSSGQIGKLLVIDRESPELIDLVDRGILTVSQAYLQTQRTKKERDSRKPSDGPKPIDDNPAFIFHQKSSRSMVEVGDGEVDLIFTSPPYWNKRKYDEDGGLGNEPNPGDYVTNLVDHFGDCYRVVNQKGSFFLNMGDTFLDGNLLNLPHRIVIGLQDQGWILRNTIIWAKTNPKPQSSKSNLTPTYEFIFHLVKGLGYKYEHTLIPLKHDTKSSHAPRHRELDITTGKTYPYIPREGKNMGDWWSDEIVRSAVVSHSKISGSKEHPAPFPRDIVTVPLLQTTDENDLVLDPFMGSGTVGQVSNEFGRRFIGYDIQTY